MRLILPLTVTGCWLVGVVGMFAASGPWAFLWMAGVAVSGYCLVDVWADAWRARAGLE
jgi:hypothetical protein